MNSATDELRRMLDERGEEHYDGTECTLWLKDGFGYRASADEGLSGFIHLHLWCTTPEQAIEATLGRGTCHNLAGQDEDGEWGFRCSECGAMPKYGSGEYHLASSGELPDGTRWLGDSWLPWRFCPCCGREVVGA